jgi:hypothetical protein
MMCGNSYRSFIWRQYKRMASKDAEIDIVGLNSLVRDLRKAQPELVAEVKAANLEAAELVTQQAKFLVPERSGKLKASLRASGTNRAGIVRAGKAAVPYAGPIHFGWPKRNIKPQPFIYEALDKRIGEVLDAYEKRINNIVKELNTNKDGS